MKNNICHLIMAVLSFCAIVELFYRSFLGDSLIVNSFGALILLIIALPFFIGIIAKD